MFGPCEQTPVKNSELTDCDAENNSTPNDTLVSGEKKRRPRGRPKGSKNMPKRALLKELNAPDDPSKEITKPQAITKEAVPLDSSPVKSLERKMSEEIVEPEGELDEVNEVAAIEEVTPIVTNTLKESEQSEKKSANGTYRDNAQVEKNFLEDLEVLSDNSESPRVKIKTREKWAKMVEEKKRDPIFVKEKIVKDVEKRSKSEDHPRIYYRNCKFILDDYQKDHSVVVYNIESRVDEEILFELFCKAGRIKRMNLYRINRNEIDNSEYLRSLGLSERSTMPHKKKAIIEYYSSIAANRAMEIFHQLRLFGKKIFVMKRRDEVTKYNIMITRPKNEFQWLDDFFLMDFLLQACNPLRVSIASRDPQNYPWIRLFVYFYSPREVDKAKELIRKDLSRYLDPHVEIRYNVDYYISTTTYQREGMRPHRFERSRSPAIRRSKPARQATPLSDLESGEERIEDIDRSP